MSGNSDNNEKNKNAKKPVKVYAEKAETKVPELSQDDMKALALAYAKYLAEKDLKPGDATFVDPEDLIKADAPAEAEAEAAPDMKALASEYALLLKKNDLKPGEKAPVEEAEQPKEKSDEQKKKEIMTALEEATVRYKKNPPKKKAKPDESKAFAKKFTAEEKQEKSNQKKIAKQAKRKEKAKAAAEKKKASGAAEAPLFRNGKFENALVSVLDLHDRLQDKHDESFGNAGRGFIRGMHNIASTYRHSRKQIGIGLLVVGVLAAGILILFDSFTVYEYAYNGKVLGYVKEQEEVTEVLDIAGEKLSQNNGGVANVEFVANQNVTFSPVDGRGKSTDDMDTAVNKLIYMTDIETEAYAVCDGDRIVAIVKDESSAETLLEDSLTTLSRPDSGMELVSAEFVNELSIKPINVLLSSVQSSGKALSLMTKGGNMETLHIVEEGETLESIAETFGVDPVNIEVYGGEDSSDEEESETAVTVEEENEDGEEVQQGDMVCIKSTVDPVTVRMVETGKMKETIEYETIKKKSDEYYQGDTHLEQEGRNGTQIFEGTLTKVAGEIVDRDEISTTVIKEKKDKIILIGTKERPKTAPTGTYALPLEHYSVTSEFGWRWGRQHSGIDLAVSSGTPVYATDGGTVVRAGWFGGYGNCVDIDHENGRVTRYGHNSALLVKVGDKVYQGQEIALVGSTGNSTGPHLHFEVILNGVQQNPRNFLQF